MFIHKEVEATKSGKLYQLLKCSVTKWKAFCAKHKVKPVENETSIIYAGETYVLGEEDRKYPNQVTLWKDGVMVDESECTIVT